MTEKIIMHHDDHDDDSDHHDEAWLVGLLRYSYVIFSGSTLL
jgi:hypothetical protein